MPGADRRWALRGGDLSPPHALPIVVGVSAEPIVSNVPALGAVTPREPELLDAAFSFVARLDPDGTVREASRASLRFVSAAREEVVGHRFWETPWWEHAGDGDRARLRDAVARAAADSFVRDEYRQASPGGRIVVLDLVLSPLFDAAGGVSAIAAVAHDVTDRALVAAARSATEERLAGIISMASDAIVSVDEQQRIVLFNQGAERIFGYTAAEILGQSLELLIPEHFRASHARQIAGVRGGPTIMRQMTERGEIYGRRRNGQLFPAEASISKFEVAGRPVLTAVVRDVSERRQMEEQNRTLLARESVARMAAEAAERRAAFLSEVSGVINASLDYEGTVASLVKLIVPSLASFCLIDLVASAGEVRATQVAHADPALHEIAERIRAFTRERMQPLLARESLRGRTELVTDATASMLEGRATDAEHRALLLALAPTSFVSVPLRAHGLVVGAITLCSVGESRRLGAADLALAEDVATRAAIAVDNARLYHSAIQASTLRDRTLGVVSHDLRGPLSAIAMAARGLEAAAEHDAAVRESLDTIGDATRLMQRLIQDLLDVASIEAGRLTLRRSTVDPVILLVRATDMFEGLAADRSVSLRLELPDQLPRLQADEDRLLQVIGNIIDNAIKFTPSGGTITVRAREERGGLAIEIADTGVGIPPAELPHIFDRFWHADRGSLRRGTGLGLAIARQIVELHGGRIDVASDVGRGTTFRLTLRG